MGARRTGLFALTALGCPGLGTPLRDIPATVQSATARELSERDARDLADHLGRGFAGVSLNDAQGNPFQQSLNYRGFTASPLLGVPQGLSVFVDGVRVNEAFGDMVNWDLIARNAIATAHLVSGSNPVFGLNTLGGVLSIQTKSGFAFPGSALRLAGGKLVGRAGVLLIDPGIRCSELACLANDLSGSGQTVVAGFSTHPHWDHVLWHDSLGEAPRYGTARCAADIRDLVSNEGWKTQVGEALPPDLKIVGREPD